MKLIIDDRSDGPGALDDFWHYLFHHDGQTYLFAWDTTDHDVTVSRYATLYDTITATNYARDETILLDWYVRYFTPEEWEALRDNPEAFLLELVL